MSVTRREVERIAALAALAVDDDTLPTLTQQIQQILAYVSQLDAVQSDAREVELHPMPGPVPPLREDRVRRPDPPVDPTTFAPVFENGLFLGPSPGQLERE